MTVRFLGIQKFSKKKILFRFAQSICRQTHSLNRPGEICFIFVSDKQIQTVNWKFLNHDYPTDVIAFNYPFSPASCSKSPLVRGVPRKGGVCDVPFGDVYISLDTARTAARRGRYPVYKEIALLIVHGLLHLIGYEDHIPNKQKKMFKKQRELFQTIAPDLAPPDFR